MRATSCGHPVVVVAGDGGAVVIHDGAGLGRKDVPAGGSAAVLVQGAFDLERRGGHAQGEAGRDAG